MTHWSLISDDTWIKQNKIKLNYMNLKSFNCNDYYCCRVSTQRYIVKLCNMWSVTRQKSMEQVAFSMLWVIYLFQVIPIADCDILVYCVYSREPARCSWLGVARVWRRPSSSARCSSREATGREPPADLWRWLAGSGCTGSSRQEHQWGAERWLGHTALSAVTAAGCKIL